MGNVMVFLGGIIPDRDHESMFSSGVRAIFGPGSRTDEILSFLDEANSRVESGAPIGVGDEDGGVGIDGSRIPPKISDTGGNRRDLSRLLTYLEKGMKLNFPRKYRYKEIISFGNNRPSRGRKIISNRKNNQLLEFKKSERSSSCY